MGAQFLKGFPVWVDTRFKKQRMMRDWESRGNKGFDLMKKTMLMAAMLAALCFGAPANVSAASLVARVDVGSQTMTVSRKGQVLYRWKVSTARKGYVTPRGTYRPQRLHKMWYSRKYEMSPMPWSVFYHGGYAIHGTNAVRRLGTPASHGCVRLRTVNAAKFYALVKEAGPANTKIIVAN
jgi:lipoprotein-anchoring transpeptidase ErfK/SrfK